MNIIKKSLIIFCLLLLLIITGCSKNNHNNENNEDNKEDNTDNPPVEVDTLTVQENIPNLYIGESLNVEITSSKDVDIIVKDPTIIKFEGHKLTALKEGTTSFDITLNELKETRTINVLNPLPTITDVTMYVGDMLSLTNNLPTKVFEKMFITNNSDAIMITSNTIFAKKEGNAVIKINYYNLKKEINVRVIDKDSASFTISNLPTAMTIGDTLTLDINQKYADDQLNIEVSNKDLLNINDKTIKALNEGEVKLTISSTLTNYKLEQTIKINYNWPTDTIPLQGVYLGVKNYGTVNNSTLDNFIYRFNINGQVKEYSLKKVGNYELHNILEEGSLYGLTLNNNIIVNLTKYDTTNKKILTGKLNSFDGHKIIVNDHEYEVLQSTKAYKINKKAGGTTISIASLSAGDYVILTLSDHGYIDNIYSDKEPTKVELPLNPVAGERTLTNFLRIALSAVGHALYIYGGAWDYQDVGSSNQARSIGVADSWIQFFYEQDGKYNYKNTTQASSYYPFGAYNEYYYAGVDCSGFVGWVMYNLMNTTSGNEGFVMSANKMAKTFSERGFGTYTTTYSAPTSGTSDFKPGDIISCTGHVWICLGVCDDGSMVIIHSTPSQSKSGYNGGGAQLGAIGNDQNCQAYKLADSYNKKYYPDWSSRYDTSLKSYSTYLARGNTNNGKFSWYINDNGVLDPDSLINKKPAEILKIIFNEE